MKPPKPHKRGSHAPPLHEATRREQTPDDRQTRGKHLRNEQPRPPEKASRVTRVVRERWSNTAGQTSSERHAPRPEARGNYADSHTENHPATHDHAVHVHGVKPVLELLRAAARPLERLLILDTAHDARFREIVELARASGAPVRRVGRSEIERVAGADANHQGIVALTAAARYHDADELLTTITTRTDAARTPLVIVLDGVEDPRNLGAVIRTAECAAADGVFIPERRAAGLTDIVAKTAAGALEYLPIARATNTADLLERMKRRGIWTIGAVADAKMDYTEWDWRASSAIVLGGEGAGLRRLVRERCDALVRIPLLGRIESLNVSVAAAVILYEAVRQRKGSDR